VEVEIEVEMEMRGMRRSEKTDLMSVIRLLYLMGVEVVLECLLFLVYHTYKVGSRLVVVALTRLGVLSEIYIACSAGAVLY